MTYEFAFEKLDVWQKSRKLAGNIYKTTSTFPENEKYGIISQLRRASISICSNIAEGNSRTSFKDRARFFQIAYSSSMEVLNQHIISSDLDYMTASQLSEFRGQIEEISNKLNALYRREKNKIVK